MTLTLNNPIAIIRLIKNAINLFCQNTKTVTIEGNVIGAYKWINKGDKKHDENTYRYQKNIMITMSNDVAIADDIVEVCVANKITIPISLCFISNIMRIIEFTSIEELIKYMFHNILSKFNTNSIFDILQDICYRSDVNMSVKKWPYNIAANASGLTAVEIRSSVPLMDLIRSLAYHINVMLVSTQLCRDWNMCVLAVMIYIRLSNIKFDTITFMLAVVKSIEIY